jgi:hypothetical protein
VKLVDPSLDLGVGEAVWRYEASPDVEYAEPNILLYFSVTSNDQNCTRM